MNQEKLSPRELVGLCVKSMRYENLPINLNSLLFGIVYDGESDGWTYFDELAHDMTDKLQGVELTDDEIMTTIKRFVQYSEADK
ncbi:MAG: hypothetical protein LKF37_09385 [Lentilactobacillus diolivorans]|jgi:hypothetical protein|nr:hypothetical protein [Lentilactobacillus diolivorans]